MIDKDHMTRYIRRWEVADTARVNWLRGLSPRQKLGLALSVLAVFDACPAGPCRAKRKISTGALILRCANGKIPKSLR